MIINLKDRTIKWHNGSHIANVYLDNIEIDCYSFAFEKNKASALDFLSSTLVYLEEE